MSTARPRRWLLPAIPLGLGVATCAACCALPLLAALGLGAAGLGAVASFGEPLGFAFMGIGAVLAVGIAVRARKRAASCASSACSVDGSCACRSTTCGADAGDASCSLDDAQVDQRLGEFRSLLARSLMRRERTEDGFVWTLRAGPNIENEARALAAKERSCCGFFRFDVRARDGKVLWHASSPPSGRPMLETLYRTSEGIVPASG